MVSTSEVYGVSNELIHSYVEREEVDGALIRAIELKKQIIIHGSSKQGKSQLIQKHLPKEKITVVECSPKSQLLDIYKSVIRQNGINILVETTTQESIGSTIGGAATVKVNIPVVAGADVQLTSSISENKEKQSEFKTVEYNLALAQDVSELLRQINFNKFIVLENFHYLPEEVQIGFSFDLRIFQDKDIRFIVLGIWRERDRLAQFNGDLQDRIIEVAVEPWKASDLKNVIAKGQTCLNVDFSEVEEEIIKDCFDSVGVLQELCKESCLAANVTETQASVRKISEANYKIAIKKKLEGYTGRHMRSLESFSDSPRRMREGQTSLFIPYYFVKVLLNTDFEQIPGGFRRKELQEAIIRIHHKPASIKSADMSNFLYYVISYQLSRGINPPLFDFDRSVNTLRIIDSTLYFFLRHCDKEEILEAIAPP